MWAACGLALAWWRRTTAGARPRTLSRKRPNPGESLMARTPTLSRRDWLRLSTLGLAGASMAAWLETLPARTIGTPQRKRSCILLWMAGGPSQMDTFDLKPGHANGGPFQEIATTVPGIRVSQHLPQLAKQAKRLAVIRSMSTKEG